jgi:hypothetical protein
VNALRHAEVALQRLQLIECHVTPLAGAKPLGRHAGERRSREPHDREASGFTDSVDLPVLTFFEHDL